MKKALLFFYLMIFLFHHQAFSQSCQWAYTVNSSPRSQAVAVKEDHNGNYYFASYTDSVTTRLYTQLEKHDANQQLVWQKQIVGTVGITDVEINAANHAIVTGYFTGTISIDGNILNSVIAVNTGFIFEADESGTVLWVHTLNPLNDNFEPVDLYIAANSNMYLTSAVLGTSGMCAFHQLDSGGNIIKSEFTTNFDNRTFSHILADDDGNVYLSGTCGNAAVFDTITANNAFSYENFLVKYDSTFKAQWFISKGYITFDDNNRLTRNGQDLYWVFDDFNGGSDTLKIIKTDLNGQVNAEIDGPLSMAFFPAMDFSMDRFGNSILLINSFTRFYLYQYDAAFNIVWTDTIYTHTSGYPLHSSLVCYDSSFYISSYYMSDTLLVGGIQLINPNANANFPSDIFVSKWKIGGTSGLSSLGTNAETIQLFPNPADDYLEMDLNEVKNIHNVDLMIFDIAGKVMVDKKQSVSNLKLNTSLFPAGMYFVKAVDENSQALFNGKFIIAH